MKSIFFTIISLCCAMSVSAGTSRLKIGHRNANQVAVLDITPGHFQAVAVQAMSAFNYVNIKIASIDISDNVFNPHYYASIGIALTYQEPGSKDVMKISFLYPIEYDALTNSYYGGNPDILTRKGGAGANPDNNFCQARNCVGCPTLRDMDGKTMGCGICVPFNDNPYSCTVENLSGSGTERIISALGGLIKGLAGILF